MIYDVLIFVATITGVIGTLVYSLKLANSRVFPIGFVTSKTAPADKHLVLNSLAVRAWQENELEPYRDPSEFPISRRRREEAILYRAQSQEQLPNRLVLDEIVEQYRKPILELAFRLTGNMQEAKDIYRSTVLMLSINPGYFKSGAPPASWVFRIVTELCSVHLQKQEAQDTKRYLEINAGRYVARRLTSKLSPRERIIIEMIHRRTSEDNTLEEMIEQKKRIESVETRIRKLEKESVKTSNFPSFDFRNTANAKLHN